MVNVPGLIASIISNFFIGIAAYFPQFVAGLLVLLIGLTLASILRDVLKLFLNFIKI